jgi:hypothetical protein
MKTIQLHENSLTKNYRKDGIRFKVVARRFGSKIREKYSIGSYAHVLYNDKDPKTGMPRGCRLINELNILEKYEYASKNQEAMNNVKRVL